MNPSIPTTLSDAPAIRAWLIDYLATLLKRPRERISSASRFDQLGLDSLSAVVMGGDLGEALGRPVDPVLLYDHPTIRELADHLAAGSGAAA